MLVGIYGSPSSNTKHFLSKLNVTIEILVSKYRNAILAGDINFNVLDENRIEHKLLVNILTSHGMKYLTDFPTRVERIRKCH